MSDTEQTNLTTAEIISKTRRIEIRTSRLVNELFGGRYLSTFKGRGMEFLDVREYVPGDDIRNIHWNVTARLGHPYIKRFTEERELTIIVAVDVSMSQSFGTKHRFKAELAAELVALLSFAALKNNDKIGLLLFSDQVESYVSPRKSKSHILRLIRDVLGSNPQKSGTNISSALEYLNQVQKKRAIVFLISDFIDTHYEKNLRLTKKHHDTIAFVLEDPMEAAWPPVGKILIYDAEKNERAITPTGNARFRNYYANLAAEQARERDLIFARNNIDRVIFKTNLDYIKPLMSFFKERVRRFR